MDGLDTSGPAGLRGARFPGGRMRIEPYESVLMHDAVRSARSSVPHPIWAFVAPQRGMGMTLDELLAWFGSSADEGPLLGACTLEFRGDLATGRDYRVRGRVEAAERKHGRSLGVFDRVTFTLDLLEVDGGSPTVSATSTFLLPRSGRSGRGRSGSPSAVPADPSPGRALPCWEPGAVGEQEMKLLALLLRDPNPLHIDADAAGRLGLGEGPVNQGPANLAYVLTMLVQGLPDLRLRRVTARFLGHVRTGDRVVAGGVLTGTSPLADGGVEARCEIALRRGEEVVVEGTATLRGPVPAAGPGAAHARQRLPLGG